MSIVIRKKKDGSVWSLFSIISDVVRSVSNCLSPFEPSIVGYDCAHRWNLNQFGHIRHRYFVKHQTFTNNITGPFLIEETVDDSNHNRRHELLTSLLSIFLLCLALIHTAVTF